METPQGRRKPGGSTRGAQEEHKRSTRATQEEHKRARPNPLACSWLVPGLCLALGAFARHFCIHNSSFCLRPSVALGGFGGRETPGSRSSKTRAFLARLLVRSQEPVRIQGEEIPSILSNLEIERLADRYLAQGIIPATKREDALHVAHATVHGLDILLSWNFRHLANVRREGLIAAVNQQEGYRHALRLLSPLEVEDDHQS